MGKMHCAGVCVGLFVSGIACGQNPDSLADELPGAFPVAVTFFAPLFVPKVLQDEYRLKEYLCSDDFAAFRGARGDVQAVDELFRHALRLSWNNVYEALLLSFVCSIEHRNFGVKLPVIGSLLWVPLTSEFPEEFARRVRSLPSKLYPDTPKGQAGDRDKLQHFFGSAFLTYTFESSQAADRVGLFIEWGEDKFIVEGSLDERDIRANAEGQCFGERLLSGERVLPSGYIGGHALAPARHVGCAPEELPNAVSQLLEER